jgi:hypothetical protein
MDRAAATWACLLALLAPACAGEDVGPGPFTSGLDGDRPLGELTSAEVKKVCKAVETWATAAIPLAKRATLVCKSGAIAAALLTNPLAGTSGLQSVCQRTYGSCLQQTDNAPAAVTCPTPGPDCTATVAEYERCLNDLPATFDQAIEAIPSCDDLTIGSLLQTGLARPTLVPPSCATYQEHCPGARITGFPTGP